MLPPLRPSHFNNGPVSAQESVCKGAFVGVEGINL
jgi:hypothetical protein